MPKFRKKPVEIEAVQYIGGQSTADILFWMGQRTTIEPDGSLKRTGIYREGRLFIRTLEGEMEAGLGDWVIRGVKGEFYPCKPDIFAATYDPA